MNFFINIFIYMLVNILEGSLLNPPNESFITRIHILFEWEQTPEASDYQFQLSNNIDFENLIVDINTSSLIYIDTENINWEGNYFWRVRPYNNMGILDVWTPVFSFTTGSSISGVETDIIDNIQINNGLIIFGAFFNYFSAVIDRTGKEIWNSGLQNIVYYNTSTSGDIFGCYLSPDSENNLPGIEFSFEEGIVWNEPNDNFLHHDLIQIPNGNYLGIIEESSLGVIPIGEWTSSFQNLGFQADGSTVEFPWIGDRLVEWDKDTKEIVWSWSVFDYFSMEDYDEYGGTWNQAFIDLQYDWTHVNAVIFDEEESAIYFSTRHLSRITKIDYPSGDIIWNIGYDMSSDDIDMGSDLGFSFQHSLQKLENGNILTLDNGNLSPQFRGTEVPITRAIEIEIENNNATLAWSYELSQELFGFASGNVQKLENGNVLITTVGGSGTSLEVTESGQIVWEAQYNLGLPNGAVYRADNISSLYPAAFSVSINNFMEYNGNVGVYIPPGNSVINFTLNHEGSIGQSFSFSIQDQENWFQNQQGNVFLESGEYFNLSFEGFVSEILDENLISLIIYPDNHPEKEKIIQVNAYTNPLTQIIDSHFSNFELKKLYPNPFNSKIKIDFFLSSSEYIFLQIYNVKGQLIETLIENELIPGDYSISWDASKNSSGVYFVKCFSKSSSYLEKVLYLK